MILAVDLGNYNIKTSEGVVFSSRFVKDNNKVEPLESSSIEYNGNTYYMERGNFENEFNKAKKNYMPNLLYAIAKSVPEDVPLIKLVLGVPLSNLAIGDKFKDELENRTIEFKYNNKTRTILIAKVAIIAEGVSSYYSLNETQRSSDCVVIDIGGRTVNIVSYKNKKMDIKATYPEGMIQLYDKILKIENSEGNNYSVEIVQEYIDKGIFSSHDEIKSQFLDELLDYIQGQKIDLKAFHIYWTGGGSINLENCINDLKLKNSKLMSDCIFSNVEGNRRVAEIKWR